MENLLFFLSQTDVQALYQSFIIKMCQIHSIFKDFSSGCNRSEPLSSLLAYIVRPSFVHPAHSSFAQKEPEYHFFGIPAL